VQVALRPYKDGRQKIRTLKTVTVLILLDILAASFKLHFEADQFQLSFNIASGHRHLQTVLTPAVTAGAHDGTLGAVRSLTRCCDCGAPTTNRYGASKLSSLPGMAGCGLNPAPDECYGGQ